MKVVFCTPTRERPHDAYLAAMHASIPALDAAGIEHTLTFEVGSPYISWACANMLHRALDTDYDTFMFVEDDHSWRPSDIVRLLEAEGDVCAGTYRFKHADDRIEYMGTWHTDSSNLPVGRLKDSAIKAAMVPSGFLKVTRRAVRAFMRAYPELVFGVPEKPAIDLFNHGVIIPNDGRWWGQDYAFSRRWTDCGGDLWIVPDLSINHHDWKSDRVWQGNLHEYLLSQPGGLKHREAA